MADKPIDTTDQQAVTVAQEAMYLIRKGGYFYRPNAQGYTTSKAEAGRYTLADAIAHSHPNGPDGPRDGMDYMLADEQAASGLASVSSASADYVLVPCEPTQDQLIAGNGMFHTGEVPLNIYRAMLAASPEPVPATNQAGEVESAARAVLARWDGSSRETMVELMDSLRAALATQPATSQEGEAELRAAFLVWRKAVARHDGFLVEGRDVTSGAVRRSGQRCASTYSALADLAVKALPRLLAANPTPPPLPEDLREGDDEAPCTTCDDTGITWGTERPCACAAGAALAQVKAS